MFTDSEPRSPNNTVDSEYASDPNRLNILDGNEIGSMGMHKGLQTDLEALGTGAIAFTGRPRPLLSAGGLAPALEPRGEWKEMTQTGSISCFLHALRRTD